MTTRVRHGLWLVAGAGFGVVGIVAIVGVGVGQFGTTFWRVIGALVIALMCLAAALAGSELIARRRLSLLGWWMLATAPAELVTLLVANWKEHVSLDYANGLVTATVLLLSGLVVATLRLIVDIQAPAVVATFSSVVLATLVLDVLAIVLVWAHATPDVALRTMLALIVVIVVLYLLTPIVHRFSRPHRA